jgi:hypothetical protein
MLQEFKNKMIKPNDYNDYNDYNKFPNLCIPRVHLSVTKELVFEIINKYSFGNIEKIDVIKKKG